VKKVKEAAPEKKCVDASGKPAWCDAEGAMPATEEDVKKVKEAAPEKKCVDASGEPTWCDAKGAMTAEEAQKKHIAHRSAQKAGEAKDKKQVDKQAKKEREKALEKLEKQNALDKLEREAKKARMEKAEKAKADSEQQGEDMDVDWDFGHPGTTSQAKRDAERARRQAEKEKRQKMKLEKKGDKKTFYIANDPFFVVNGKKGHFWIQAGSLTKLLSVPLPDNPHPVELHGETFGDGEASQWFKKYRLVIDGENIVNVEVGAVPNAKNDMRTMTVHTNGHVLSPPRNVDHHVGHNVTVKAQAMPIKKIGNYSAEEVIIKTPAISFTIWTQQANKFDVMEKRVKYAHLNMEVEGGLPSNAEGLAAEFAGVRPISAEAQKLLEMPYSIAQERKEAKHMRKWIAKNKRRLAKGLKESVSLETDANMTESSLEPGEKRAKRHQRRERRHENKRLMKGWERKLAVHARKEALREARGMIPASM